jgi:hypothetical protein
MQVFVPTSETVSLRFFLDMMLALKKPIMFVGGAGTVGVHALHLLSLNRQTWSTATSSGTAATAATKRACSIQTAERCQSSPCFYPARPHPPGWLQGKTQLVKGKLQGLPEDLSSLTINLNYFSDVASFQKVGRLGWERAAAAGLSRVGPGWSGLASRARG